MSVLTAKGVNGQLSFDGATVVITREGFIARSTHGRSEKVYPLKSIGSVQFRAATALLNGFIQFAVSGESSKGSLGFGKKADAANDENAITFRKAASADFEAIRDAIRDAQAAPVGAPVTDLADQIGKLSALRDQGILTAEEFDVKKAELLARI